MSMVERARRSAGMTQQQAAELLGVSVPTYIKKEQNPRKMRFDEFGKLAGEMDAISKSILWCALKEAETVPKRHAKLGDMTIGEWCGAKADRAVADEFEAMRRNFFADEV